MWFKALSLLTTLTVPFWDRYWSQYQSLSRLPLFSPLFTAETFSFSTWLKLATLGPSTGLEGNRKMQAPGVSGVPNSKCYAVPGNIFQVSFVKCTFQFKQTSYVRKFWKQELRWLRSTHLHLPIVHLLFSIQTTWHESLEHMTQSSDVSG